MFTQDFSIDKKNPFIIRYQEYFYNSMKKTSSQYKQYIYEIYLYLYIRIIYYKPTTKMSFNE